LTEAEKENVPTRKKPKKRSSRATPPTRPKKMGRKLLNTIIRHVR